MNQTNDTQHHRTLIEAAFEERKTISPETAGVDLVTAIEASISGLEQGVLRVAEPGSDGWHVNEWLKKAVLLYFRIRHNEVIDSSASHYFDKVPLRWATGSNDDISACGARIVPPATVRRGAFIGHDAVLMPSYVNIGAYVGEATMVDTWATVGSCAQVGKNVHLSGGVGIGGVLEPVQAAPVIIEDNCFIGSRSIVVEGVRIESEAVLGANVVITNSTRIIDVTGSQPVEMKGVVPPRSVVIPGSYTKSFPAGDFQVACALIIGRRKPSTDLKTSLNEVIREYNIAV